MPTRKKPIAKTATSQKPKAKSGARIKKASSKKKINLGGNIGPLGWIVAAALIGYIGWAVSHSGAVKDADASTQDGKLATVRLYPNVGTTVTGGSLAMTAEAYDANNRQITSGVDYSWQAIARDGVTGTITESGRQATLTAGNQAGVMGVSVKATSGRQSASSSINVLVNPAPGIGQVRIYPLVGNLAAGDSSDFTAQSFDSTGKEIKSGVRYQWKVTNANGTLASLDQAQRATAELSAGSKEGVVSLMVSATYQGKIVENTIQVLVYQPAKLSKVAIYPVVGTVKAGKQLELTASTFDSNNKEIDSGVVYKWTIVSGANTGADLSSNKAEATLTAGMTKGLVRVQVQATKDGVTVSQSTNVTVQ
jgi:hypothetical protein